MPHTTPIRPRPGWSGVLAIGSGVVVYNGPGSVASRHRHDAIQLVWSCGRQFHLDMGETEVAARAAVVPARREHSFEATSDELFIVLVEPAGRLGRATNRFAEAHVGIDIVERLGRITTPPKDDADALLAWSRQVLARITGDAGAARHAGVRPEVLAAASYIESQLDGVPRLSDAAGQVALSPRQLSRSFTAEIGMPFRRFLVWSRLRRAVICVGDGADLTAAAAAAGFADSAHFSRVFRRMFGLSPSEVLPLLRIAEADVRAG